MRTFLEIRKKKLTYKVDQLVSGSSDEKNQANKSTGWMPRHQTPMKDVASCEKSRGTASRY